MAGDKMYRIKAGNTEWDVVIVGSGLSGLTTAYRLLQAKPDLRILVTDSLAGYGGRTKSIDLPQYKAKVSVGGTFSMMEHDATLGLAAELGKYPEDYLSMADVNLKLFSPDLLGATSAALGLPMFLELMWKGAKVFNGGDILWDSDTAKKLDSKSLEAWIQEQSFINSLHPDFTREFFYLLETYPDLATVSALQCALSLYVRFWGIPHNGFEIPPKILRWEGGTGAFTEALVDALRKHGDNFQLLLNSPVEQVVQSSLSPAVDDDHPVTVTINQDRAAKLTVRTKYVVVAASPLASAPKSRGGTIEYQPPLPQDSTTLFSSMVATPTVSLNILVVYPQRWWYEYGGIMILPEYAHHVHGKGVWGNIVDASMDQEDAYGIVRIFCDSRRVENWTEDAIKASALDFLKTLFPGEEPARLIDGFVDIIIWDWNLAKPSLPGVTFTFPPSGVLSANGHAMTRPHGRVHWGGSERSVWGTGWMEGAVQRGNDVAKELLKAADWAPAGYDWSLGAKEDTTEALEDGWDDEEEIDTKSSCCPCLSFGGVAGSGWVEMPGKDDANDNTAVLKKEDPNCPETATPTKTSLAASASAKRRFVPKNRMELAAHLFTEQQKRTLGHEEMVAHLDTTVKRPEDRPEEHWISPANCLKALKGLHDMKEKRRSGQGQSGCILC